MARESCTCIVVDVLFLKPSGCAIKITREIYYYASRFFHRDRRRDSQKKFKEELI